MAYFPIETLESTPIHLAFVVKEVINPLFHEFHYLLSLRIPDHGTMGSCQITQAIVLVALADGAAQLFWTGKPTLGQGDRFKAFLKHYYPWEADEPVGFTRDEAVEFLWTDVRCAMLHRFGTRYKPKRALKYGNPFQRSEEEVEQIERSQERPASLSFLQQKDTGTLLWIENFYWGLRQAIGKVVHETPERIEKIEEWIANGKFDHMAKK